MNSAARSGSTAFQVLPSTFSDEPTMQPSATVSTSRHGRVLDAGIGEHRRVRQHCFTASRSDIAAASPVIAPETRIASGMRREHRAPRPVGEAPPVERIGELGRDVVEHREVAAGRAGRGSGAPRRHPGVHGPMSEA